MSASKTKLVIPFVLTSAICATGHAQTTPPATQFTVGVKIWNASWQSYLPATYTGVGASGTPAAGSTVDEVEGTSSTDIMPFVSVRHDKLFASLSHGRFSSDFHVGSSPVITSTGQTQITWRNDHFVRRETDLNLGYFVTPEVAIVLGYKDAIETRDVSLGIAPQATPLVKTTGKVFLLGAVGSFAVYEKLRFYAQAAYGPARLKLTFANPSFGSDNKTNGRYLIGELGLTYPVFANPSGFGGATVSLGYRTQTVKTDSNSDITLQNRKLRDVRDGAVLSMNYTF